MLLLVNAGYVTQREGRARLSPKGVRKIGQLALRDIYQGLLRDRPGSHPTDHRGTIEIKPEETKRYQHGDPLALDLVATLKEGARPAGRNTARRPSRRFVVHSAAHTTTTSTVLLLDMSWSMSWEGRFPAREVAMAMESLIRSRYPRDYFAIVGFYTRAVELKLRDLPEASWNMGDPFTNLQDGPPRRRRPARAPPEQQPAHHHHHRRPADGILPPRAPLLRVAAVIRWISMRAAQETLREVERVTRRGITINTFMLDDSPSLRAFVERMTRINKGRALYTRPTASASTCSSTTWRGSGSGCEPPGAGGGVMNPAKPEAERRTGGRQGALLEQYLRIRGGVSARHRDAILLFRLGDFLRDVLRGR